MILSLGDDVTMTSSPNDDVITHQYALCCTLCYHPGASIYLRSSILSHLMYHVAYSDTYHHIWIYLQLGF